MTSSLWLRRSTSILFGFGCIVVLFFLVVFCFAVGYSCPTIIITIIVVVVVGVSSVERGGGGGFLWRMRS